MVIDCLAIVLMVMVGAVVVAGLMILRTHLKMENRKDMIKQIGKELDERLMPAYADFNVELMDRQMAVIDRHAMVMARNIKDLFNEMEEEQKKETKKWWNRIRSCSRNQYR